MCVAYIFVPYITTYIHSPFTSTPQIQQERWDEYECTYLLIPSPAKLRAKHSQKSPSLQPPQAENPVTPEISARGKGGTGTGTGTVNKKCMITQSYDWMVQYLAVFFGEYTINVYRVYTH